MRRLRPLIWLAAAVVPWLLLATAARAQLSVVPDMSTYATKADMAASVCKWNYVAGTPVTIGATTTEVSIASAPQQGSLTIPTCATAAAAYFQVHVDGVYTAALTPGTLTQYIKLNGIPVCSVTLGNIVSTSGANYGAHGNAYVTISATGAVRCSGFLGYQISNTAEAPGYWQTVGSPAITPGTTLTFDYTGKWSMAVNSITATAVFATLTR